MNNRLATTSLKMVFLDRDGVVNHKADKHEYIKERKAFRLLPGAAKAIRMLNQNGCKVIIITNQRGIARGVMTEDDLYLIHEKMKSDLKKENAFIDKIYYCPHEIAENCTCRKPNIGMFLQAALDFEINKETSYMAGDSLSDIKAAILFGIKPILIGSYIKGILCADDLLAAVRNIILK